MTPQSYPQPEGDPNLGSESARDLKQLSDHIREHFGDGMVYHEIASEYVHIDLHIVKATSERPYHFVITTGMSDRAMKAPLEFSTKKYAELYLALPPEWPLDKEAFDDEEVWWPFRHLKQTARFPHVYNTWIWFGHTIGNEDPPQPFTPQAQFSGGMLYRPQLLPVDSCGLQLSEEKTVIFFPFVPLYESELRFAWENDSAQLASRLKSYNVTELINPSRPSVI